MLGGGQGVDQPSRKHVDPLHVGIADQEAPRRPYGDRQSSSRAAPSMPAGVTTSRTVPIVSCMASAQAVALRPSSPSIQQVMASPLK